MLQHLRLLRERRRESRAYPQLGRYPPTLGPHQPQGIANVRVLDRTFNYNPAHARRLLSLFCEYPHIRFHLEIHPALLTPELRAHLAQMPHGLLHLEAAYKASDKKCSP